MPAERVLLLGGRGFIGGHILRRLLDAGYGVRNLSSSPHAPRNVDDLSAGQRRAVEWYSGQLDDPSTVRRALEGCRYLIHASIPYPVYTLRWKKRWPAERAALRTVLHAALDARLAKCVFLSVCGTLGPAPAGIPLADETHLFPEGAAGTSVEMKHATEREILDFVRRGLSGVLVHPTMCVGDGDAKPSSGQMLLRFLTLPFRFMDHETVNVVDVRDVAFGTVAAMEQGRAGERYLLGNENTTLGDLAARFRRIAGRSRPCLSIPDPLLSLLCWSSETTAELLRRPRPRFPLLGLHLIRYGNRHYSIAKARRELELPQSPVDAALRRAFHWYAKNGYVPETYTHTPCRQSCPEGRVPFGDQVHRG